MADFIRTIAFSRRELGFREVATFLSCTGLALLSALFLAGSPLALSYIADVVVALTRGVQPQYAWTVSLCAAYIVFVASQRLLYNSSFYLINIIRINATKILSNIYFRSLTEKNHSFFLHKNAGRIATELNQVTNEYNNIIRVTILQVIGPIFQLVASLAILVASGQSVVAFLFALYCIGFFWSSHYFTGRLVDKKLEFMEAGRVSYDTMIDSIANISVARQFDTRAFLVERYDAVMDADRDRQAAYWRTNLSMVSLNTVFYMVLFSSSFGYAVVAALNGQLSVGQFVMIVTYVMMLTAPIEQLGDTFSQLSQSVAAFGRFLKTLNEHRMPAGRPLCVMESASALSIKSLRFSYPNVDGPVFSNLSFSVAVGQKVSVTGPSGSGKSTLFKLLTRQYDAPPGSVFLFGNDIAYAGFDDLGRLVGYVAQDTLTFKDTVLFNLLIANPAATPEMIEEALDKADLLDFVRELPKGLNTVLGDRGESISGGQKQRIAFARLFLREPQIILLDEATSALDIAIEERILRSVIDTFADQTIISISHRPTAIRMFDDIIVLRNGDLADYGKRDEVVKDENALRRIIGTS